MRFSLIIFFISLILCISIPSQASTNASNTLAVDVFLTSNCPVCTKTESFLNQIQQHAPWLQITRHYIDLDKKSLEQFYQLQLSYKQSDFIVPSTFFCNSRWIGYVEKVPVEQNPLLQGMEYCYQQLTKNNPKILVEQNVQAMASNYWIESSLVNSNKLNSNFILWILAADLLTGTLIIMVVTLFSLLVVNTRNLYKVAATVVFGLCVAFIHFIEQMYPHIFHHTFAWIRIPVLIVGCVVLAFNLRYYAKNTRANKAPPLLNIFIGSLVILCVQIYRQTQSPSVSIVFPNWLAAQKLSLVTHVSAIIGYEMVYASIVVGLALVLLWISKQKNSVWLSNFVVEFGKQFLFYISCVLILYPYVLGNPWFAWVFITLAIISTGLTLRLQTRLKK